MNDGRDELDKTVDTKEENKEKPEEDKLKSKLIKEVSNSRSELKDTSKDIYGTDPGLKPENVASFVSKCTDGLLNHYEPTFKNIRKDLGIGLK